MASSPSNCKRTRPNESSLDDPADGHTSSAEEQHMDESLLYDHESESQGAGADAQLQHAGPGAQQDADLLGLHSLLYELEASMKELLQRELQQRAQDISSDCLQMNYEVQKSSAAAEEEHNGMKSELHRLADLTQDFYNSVSFVLPGK